MTVCIAARSTNLKQVVTVSDMKFANVELGLDGVAPKSRILTSDGRWHCLFACDDVAGFESLYSKLFKLLSDLEKAVSLEWVVTALRQAYLNELREMALSVLRPLMLDLATFELRGRARLGDAAFGQMLAKIQSLETGVELLVVGFEDDDEPHILRTTKMGDVYNSDLIGFDAIGSGANIALGMLYAHPDFRDSFDIGKIIYRLCEAKFTAELSGFVDPKTVAVSFGANQNDVLLDEMLNEARSCWRRRRNSRVPEAVLSRLRQGFTFRGTKLVKKPTEAGPPELEDPE